MVEEEEIYKSNNYKEYIKLRTTLKAQYPDYDPALIPIILYKRTQEKSKKRTKKHHPHQPHPNLSTIPQEPTTMHIYHLSKKEKDFFFNRSLDEYLKRDIQTTILIKQGYKCYYCETTLLGQSHIHYISYPRKYLIPFPKNLLALCPLCYHDLLNHTQFEIYEHTKDNPCLDHVFL